MKLIVEMHPSAAAAQARANILRQPPGGGTPKPNVRTASFDEIALFDQTAQPGTETVTAKANGPLFVVLFDEP
jgi:hypothetical protein